MPVHNVTQLAAAWGTSNNDTINKVVTIGFWWNVLCNPVRYPLNLFKSFMAIAPVL
jgi:hypothetical protein